VLEIEKMVDSSENKMDTITQELCPQSDKENPSDVKQVYLWQHIHFNLQLYYTLCISITTEHITEIQISLMLISYKFVCIFDKSSTEMFIIMIL
jgi:hypothetical protein